jgi:protein O-GlcNAc transferase
MSLENQLESGIAHHRAGRFADAEKIYRQILAENPDHAATLHLLGVLGVQLGHFATAADLIRRAIARAMDSAVAHYDLGNALQNMGRFSEAIDSYRKATALDPAYAEAHNNLGIALRSIGQSDAAAASYRQAIALNADYAEAHNNIGVILKESGRIDEAINSYQRALRLKPDLADAHYNLGVALEARGKLDEAVTCYERAIRIDPNYADAHNNLGVILKNKGRLSEAIAAFRQAIRFNPNLAHAYSNLGNALKLDGQLNEAIACYRLAIELQPNYPEAHNNLGVALKDTGRLDEAIASYRRAIRLKPDYAGAYDNLGNALKHAGQIDQAIDSYREAIRLEPDSAAAHSNLILAMHYHPAHDARIIRHELHRWNERHAEPLKTFIRPHANNRDPDRRLRIGYVSPDFRDHVVGQNLLPLFREHGRDQMEIFCYADVIREDAITGELRSNADSWRSMVGLSDSESADLIRNDQIDILVDLTLHSASSRLLIFAHKPAPIQVTYLGYCSSTGLETMDYRLSDPYLDPPDSDLSVYNERTVLLPETYWCYNARDSAPELSPPPTVAVGFVTFGCLNNFTKITPSLDLWAEILRAVPRSRLIVHAHPGSHIDSVRARFAKNNVAPDRVESLPQLHWSEYMQAYNRIDISLDPFPWGGGITTCDALWMGVPVVTLAGRTAVGRGGVSILSNIGLKELIARSPDQYVQIAVELANDVSRLADLRQTLRQKMHKSPLMDAPRFARNIEAAYRQMWRSWCGA